MDEESASSNKHVPSGSNVKTSQRLPHYALPNTTHVLANYVNSEADLVRQAFTTNNYRSIKMLPTELKPNHVNDARANHVDANYTSAIIHAPYGSYKVVGKGGRYFSEFEYMPDPYSLAHDLKQEELKESKANRTDPERNFILSNSKPQDLTSKDYFHDHEIQYRNPYEDAEKVALREKWIEENKILAGPFVQSTGNKSLGKVSSGLLPDIMRNLAILLDEDWEDNEFQIYRDEEDLIIIEFMLSSIESENGLKAYMNVLCRDNALISQYKLTKVVELWSHKPGDGSIYYAFQPPWVMRHLNDVHFTLHPERASFRAMKEYNTRLREELEKQK